jgi:hypothetical protein
VAKLTISSINLDCVRRRAREVSSSLTVRRDGDNVVVEGDREYLRAIASRLPRHYSRRLSS